MKKIVNKLIKNKETISTMESCTGGMLASEITNVSGSSEILKFSAVTYSNEFKIKMGVSSKTIDKYSVYSMEVAREMSKAISDFTSSTYGVGITGKLGRVDINNLHGNDNVVFFSIYNKNNNKYYTNKIEVHNKSRKLCKKDVIIEIKKILKEVLDIK
jgi:PncC family amidohydrolase